MHKCSTVTAHASNKLCELKPKQWRAHGNSLRLDTGLIPGVRVSLGGNFTISNEQGGKIIVDYTTQYLRDLESFLILVDGDVVKEVSKPPGSGGSVTMLKEDKFEYYLPSGFHLI